MRGRFSLAGLLIVAAWLSSVSAQDATVEGQPLASNVKRVLQALDGARVGASQRDIASAIFGAGAVNASWTPDSELRAQTRYLLKRGEALARGGYRTLLNADTS